MNQGRLFWKFEDLSADADRLADVGPAWIQLFTESSGKQEAPTPVRGGDWISRREAREIAEQHGYELIEDDGGDSAESVSGEATAARVTAINDRLRTLGIDPDELRVEDAPDERLFICGRRIALLDAPRMSGKSGLQFQRVSVLLGEDEALVALDRLAPGWREAG